MLPNHQRCTAIAALTLLAGLAAAQPTLIIVPGAEDMNAAGTATVGRETEWTAVPGGEPLFSYVPYIWERGQGYRRVPGTYARPEIVRGSADLSSLMSNLENTSDWGDLNCFNGYCFGSMTNCTPGEPRPQYDPCIIPKIAHHYSSLTGWVNTGSLPRFQDPTTGRFYGGTRCDQTINSPYDISGNGQFIVGGAYSARLTHPNGGPGFGLCGDFFAFRWDAATGVMSVLPSAFNSDTTRADRVNFDGTVITGYDLERINHPNGTQDNFRRLTAWTNGVPVTLDPISNTSTTSPVNSPGTVIAGSQSSEFNVATYGQSGIRLTRWVRQPNDTWTPQNLGRPADRFEGVSIDVLVALFPSAISDDGNTIVGTAVYNALGPSGVSRAFIWRPSINNGVPMDLQDYIATLDASSPLLAEGFRITNARNISADGNTLLATFFDARNTCTNGGLSHMTFTGGLLSLNGAGISCEAPEIVTGPFTWGVDQYLPYGASLNVSASGSFPMSYQWQREDPNNPGSWIDLEQECSNFPLPGGNQTGFSPTFNYEGVYTPQLRIGIDEFGVCGRLGNYRVVVSNSCGSVASEPTELTVAAPYFVEQPQDATICATESAEFTVRNPVIEPRIRQWQLELPANSGQWVEIYGPTYQDFASGLRFDLSGEFETTLTVSNVETGTHGSSLRFRNRIQAYTFCADPGYSDPATLTITDCGCPADWDGSGGIDGDDIGAFFADWQIGEADIDQSGGTDGDDITYFFERWQAGC